MDTDMQAAYMCHTTSLRRDKGRGMMMPRIRQALGAMAIAALSVVCAVFSAHAQKEFALESITIEQDSLPVKGVKVILTFGSPPISFPVYAMTDPQRIIVDLPDTRAKESVQSFTPQAAFVKSVEVSRKTIDDRPNTRVEVYLKEDARYTALISGTQIVLSLREAEKVKKTVPVFTAAKTSARYSSVNSIEVRSMERSLELDLSFTNLPQAASIYMLESPPRIVMDFNNVFIEEEFEKQINVAPVKNISVMKREGQIPYAGVVVHLEKKVAFHYEQIENRIVVNIPWEGKKLSTRGTLMLIGTGALVAGGFVTGIILSGKEDAGGEQQPGEDLGSPPQFPDY